MPAYRDHARDLPARLRTSVPAIAACLLAAVLAVLGARVEAARAAAPEPAPHETAVDALPSTAFLLMHRPDGRRTGTTVACCHSLRSPSAGAWR